MVVGLVLSAVERCVRHRTRSMDIDNDWEREIRYASGSRPVGTLSLALVVPATTAVPPKPFRRARALPAWCVVPPILRWNRIRRVDTAGQRIAPTRPPVTLAGDIPC